MKVLARLVLLVAFASATILSNGQTAKSVKQVPQLISVPATVQPESVGMSSERLKRIDDNINSWIATGKVPGAVALIMRNGKVVYHKAFGYQDLDKTKAMRTDNIFRIASQQKQ